MTVVGVYYLHENGDLIYKSGNDEIADIRESPFAIALWAMDPSDRMSAWNILVEGLAAGARIDRIESLATKWGCDDADAVHYAERVGCVLGEDGTQKTATQTDFVNLQESPCGFGSTYLEAMAALAKEIGYKPSELWGATFESLLRVQYGSFNRAERGL